MSEDLHLRDLSPDPENLRQHTPRNVGLIVDALHEVGAARSIVIDETGRVLAGNATIEAAAEAGIERVRVVDVDGETLVAVRRTGLTDDQKRRLALYDNRAAELALWNSEALTRALQAFPTLGEKLWTSDELAMLIEDPSLIASSVPAEEWAAQGMPEFENPERAFRTIHVHFASQADVDDFAALMQQPITDRTRFVWHKSTAGETGPAQ